MKFIFLSGFLLIIMATTSAQKQVVDSLQVSYNNAKSDTARILILSSIGDAYSQSHPDSELLLAQRALFMSKKINFKRGELLSIKQMADAYWSMGNYPLALQYYFQRLQLDEKNPDLTREAVTLLSISNLYESEGDYAQALEYAKKASAIIESTRLESYRWYSYIGFGNLYEKINDLSHAKYYNQKAYEMAEAQKNKAWLGMSLNNLGNTYLKAKDLVQASGDYRRAIPYLLAENNNKFLCESYQGLSTIFSQSGQRDSAIQYAKQALYISSTHGLDESFLLSCQLLTDQYKTSGSIDSAFFYQGRLLAMKDSLYSQQKVKQIESLTISERLRQQQRQQELLDEQNERSYKLNMLFVGLCIPFFFLLSMLLSKRKVRPRVVEFSGILSLLMLFEYLTLLLHPAISDLTHHSPFLEIIILVTVAAVLTPTHHRLEHWMLHQLTRKSHPVPAVATGPSKADREESIKQQKQGNNKAAVVRKPRKK